jgi:UDP-N-acetyl-D-glucosamine/UDP-N-acetyl-D-galactosamine dehydrogenase
MTDIKIAIIGLGYVGLPLAIEFGKIYQTIGFDINSNRIKELKNGEDLTNELTLEELKNSKYLKYTTDMEAIKLCNIYIVTVPTPIDELNNPNLDPLIKASNSIGNLLKPNDIVIYESTVYPGATEEVCVPILESISGLKYNKDFFCGYSPERINPGDKEHNITTIKKVTSGSNYETADKVDHLYNSIIKAGTHKAESIKIAEAAKVIENTQRDINIALINELSVIFNKLDIDTEAVLEAAGTKWNFLPFKPGLVGGHCIGVDPYYLTHKSIEVGYHPEIILAGRRLNDGMASYVANQVKDLMTDKKIHLPSANILVMGLTFKENCPDMRNSKVINMINDFQQFGLNVDVFDPWVNKEVAIQEYGIEVILDPVEGKYDAVVMAVDHKEFREMSLDEIKKYCTDNHVLYDVKYIFKANQVDGRL